MRRREGNGDGQDQEKTKTKEMVLPQGGNSKFRNSRAHFRSPRLERERECGERERGISSGSSNSNLSSSSSRGWGRRAGIHPSSTFHVFFFDTPRAV